MKYFDHIDAETVKEAVELLRKYKGNARVIAGGTDLIGILKDRILPEYPKKIINIKTVSGLEYITEDKHGLKIGSLVRLSSIVASQIVKRNFGILAEASEAVATPEIRNMATIGGNLTQDVRCWYYRYPKSIGGPLLCMRKDKRRHCLAVNGDNRYHAIMGIDKCAAICPSDLAVALAALNARLKVFGNCGSRIIPVEEFYKPLNHDLALDEIITEIQIPRNIDWTKQRFLKFTLRRPIDFAVASVAALIRVEQDVVDDISIYLGAVSAGPIRATKAEMAMKGRNIDEVTAREASDAQLANIRPLDKNAYKLEITRDLIRRAILL